LIVKIKYVNRHEKGGQHGLGTVIFRLFS